MYKIKNLSESDIKILMDLNQPLTNGKLDVYAQQDEINQIDRFLPHIEYKDENDKPITEVQAREILGQEKFLSGIVRAVFHWSAQRDDDQGHSVYFDSSKYWCQIRKNCR